jgi:hypothetical protein
MNMWKDIVVIITPQISHSETDLFKQRFIWKFFFQIKMWIRSLTGIENIFPHFDDFLPTSSITSPLYN